MSGTDVLAWSRSAVRGSSPPRSRRRVALAAVAAVAAVIALAIVPLVFDDYVLSAILVPFLALSLAGIGQNLVTGYAGQLLVGAAAFMSVGAFATYDAHLYAGAPLLVAFAFGGVAAGAAGQE